MSEIKNRVLNRLGYDCEYKVDVLDIDETKITGDIYLPTQGFTSCPGIFTPLTVYWNFDDLCCTNTITGEKVSAGISSPDLKKISSVKLQTKGYFVYAKNGSKPTMKHKTLEEAQNEAIRISKQARNIGEEIYVMSIHDIYKSEVQVKKVQ